MSTKTIAVDARVYRKLAGLKQESESFSRLLDRLAEKVARDHTGNDILRRLGHGPPTLTAAEAEAMGSVVEQNRRAEKWEVHDLS